MIGGRRNRWCSLLVFLAVILIFIRLTLLIDSNRSIDDRRTFSSFNAALIVKAKKLESLCSTRATNRDIGQKIIAISFSGPTESPEMFSLPNSLRLLGELIDEMQEVYADNWILRIYHDEKLPNRTIISHFERRYDWVDFCNVTDLALNYIPSKIWRFLPAVDPTVAIMTSRDLDSPLTKRERAAIDEWIASNLTFHSMRDHPQHAVSVSSDRFQ